MDKAMDELTAAANPAVVNISFDQTVTSEPAQNPFFDDPRTGKKFGICLVDHRFKNNLLQERLRQYRGTATTPAPLRSPGSHLVSR